MDLTQFIQNSLEKGDLEGPDEQPFFKINNSNQTVSIQLKEFKYQGKETDEVLILMNDVSEIRKYEKLTQKKRFEVIYFASVAHDLRTPVNTCL